MTATLTSLCPVTFEYHIGAALSFGTQRDYAVVHLSPPPVFRVEPGNHISELYAPDFDQQWREQMDRWWDQAFDELMEGSLFSPNASWRKEYENLPGSWMSVTLTVEAGQCRGMAETWLFRGGESMSATRLQRRRRERSPVPQFGFCDLGPCPVGSFEKPLYAVRVDYPEHYRPIEPYAYRRLPESQAVRIGPYSDFDEAYDAAKRIDWVLVDFRNTMVDYEDPEFSEQFYYVLVPPPRTDPDEDVQRAWVERWWEEEVKPWTAAGRYRNGAFRAEVEWSGPVKRVLDAVTAREREWRGQLV